VFIWPHSEAGQGTELIETILLGQFILSLATPHCDLLFSCTSARMREVSWSEWELPVNLLYKKPNKYLSLSCPLIHCCAEAAVSS